MTLEGPRSGATFDAERDTIRLNQQALDVWNEMKDGQWWTLRALAMTIYHPEASISARIRDLRKARFGSHTVERRHIAAGIWQYRLVPNTDVKVVD